MNSESTALPDRMASFPWPSTTEMAGLATDPNATDEMLKRLLTDAVRTFAMQAGRLWLAVGAPGAVPLVCETSELASTIAPDVLPWVEQQVLARRTGLLTLLPAAPTQPHTPEAPLAVVAAPLRREGTVIGVISLAGPGTMPGPEVLEELTRFGTRLASLPICLATRPDDGLPVAVTDPFFLRSPWPLLVVDAAGRVLDLDPAAAALLERQRQEVRGLPLTAILQIAERATQELVSGTAYLLRPDGARLVVEMRMSSLFLHEGHAVTLVGLHDLSQEQSLSEARLKTAELTGVFRTVATVNHEINNPLFGLMATLQLLREELRGAEPGILKKLDRMLECSERIQQITGDLARVKHPSQRPYVSDAGMLDLATSSQEPEAPPVAESPFDLSRSVGQ